MTPVSPWPLLPTLLVVGAVYAGVILLVMGLCSLVSGWRLLARAYPCPGGCPTPKMRFASLIFRGWFGYNNGIIVSADARALHLTPWPVILAPTHPAVAIPWGEISSITRREAWYGLSFEVRTRGVPELRWGLRPRAWEFVREAALSAGVAVS